MSSSSQRTEFFDESAFPPPENKYENYTCQCVDTIDSQGFTCISKSDGLTEYFDIATDYDGDDATEDSAILDKRRFTLNGTPVTVTTFISNHILVAKCDEITCVATGDVYDPVSSYGGAGPFELSDSNLFTQVETRNPDYMGHVQCVGWNTVTVQQDKTPFFESEDATKASFAIGVVALAFAILAFVASVCGRKTPTTFVMRGPP